MKRTVSGSKRKAQEDSEDEVEDAVEESDADEPSPARRAPKRRAVTNRAYVEVAPTAKGGKGKGKAKVSSHCSAGRLNVGC